MTSMTLIWLLSGLVFTGTVLSTVFGLWDVRSKNPQTIVRNHILSRAAALTVHDSLDGVAPIAVSTAPRSGR